MVDSRIYDSGRKDSVGNLSRQDFSSFTVCTKYPSVALFRLIPAAIWPFGWVCTHSVASLSGIHSGPSSAATGVAGTMSSHTPLAALAPTDLPFGLVLSYD